MKDNEIKILLENVKSGREGAFEKLTDRYGLLIESMLKKHCVMCTDAGVLLSESDLDDVRQELSIVLYRAALAYDSIKYRGVSFGLFAKVCMRNMLISAYRTAVSVKKMYGTSPDEMFEAESDGAGMDPLAYIIDNEAVDRIHMAIIDLLTDYEQQVYRCHLKSSSVAEIAAELGKSEKSVNNALYRIRSKIKGLYTDSD